MDKTQRSVIGRWVWSLPYITVELSVTDEGQVRLLSNDPLAGGKRWVDMPPEFAREIAQGIVYMADRATK